MVESSAARLEVPNLCLTILNLVVESSFARLEVSTCSSSLALFVLSSSSLPLRLRISSFSSSLFACNSCMSSLRLLVSAAPLLILFSFSVSSLILKPVSTKGTDLILLSSANLPAILPTASGVPVAKVLCVIIA